MKARGISFTVSDQFIEAVRRAGGSGILADTLLAVNSFNTIEPAADPDRSFEHLASCAEFLHAGNRRDAIPECRAATDENPQATWPLLVTGYTLHLMDPENEESGELARRALALDHNLLANDDDPGALGRAMLYFGTGPVGGNGFLDPIDPSDENQLGPILQNRLDSEPDLAVTHVLVASRYAQVGNIEKCMSEFDAAFRLEPANPNLHADLADFYHDRQDVDGELKERREVVRIVPYGFEERAALAHFLDSLGRTDESIREWRDLLALVPDSADAENELAWIYATSRDPKYRDPAEALTLAGLAVQSSKKPVPAILDTLAEALLLNGNSEEALKTEEQAAKLAPDDQEMQTRLKHFQEAAQQAKTTTPK
jgi:tetratricopeptide (TPR) repeat protein